VGTIVPAFLGRLGSGALAVGAAATIARFGWLLPQLFTANYAQGLRYRKSIYLVGGGGRAVALGLLAAVLLAWPAAHEVGASLQLLVAFFALWTAYSFIAGLAGVPYNTSSRGPSLRTGGVGSSPYASSRASRWPLAADCSSAGSFAKRRARHSSRTH